MTAIGQMRARIRIQQNAGAPDGSGGFLAAWQDLAEVFARIEVLAHGPASRLRATHRISMHHRADVRAGMRIVHGAEVLTVLSARDPDGRAVILEVLAEAAGV